MIKIQFCNIGTKNLDIHFSINLLTKLFYLLMIFSILTAELEVLREEILGATLIKLGPKFILLTHRMLKLGIDF